MEQEVSEQQATRSCKTLLENYHYMLTLLVHTFLAFFCYVVFVLKTE